MKVVKKKSTTKKRKETKVTYSFYLGHINIPLFALFSNQKLNATFRVNRPIIILGYYTDTNNILGLDINEENANSLAPLN